MTIAAVLVHQNRKIDWTGKQNLLKYATGDYLDNLGVLTDTDRVAASAATTTLQFTLSAVQAVNIIIPAGTRVTTDAQKLYFVTTDLLTIPAGSLTGTVKAKCTSTGTAGNDIAAGSLTTIVDPVPYVASVTNTVVTGSGADIETDDSYRERIHIAPEKFSCAGPDGAYEYWAKTANADISDVYVYSNEDAVVRIVPLMTGGAIPGQEVLDAVAAVCSADKVRPLTDKVVVEAPTKISYDVNVTYNINAASKANAGSLQTAVTAAVNNYIAWQKEALGRDIDPSKLVNLMVDAGAEKVVVAAPTLTEVDPTAVAIANTVSINFGGGV